MKLILKSLLQRKLSTSLLVLQFALAIALLVNTIEIASDIHQKTSVDTRLEMDNILVTGVMPFDQIYNDRGRFLEIVERDMAAILKEPGVESVTYSSQVPFWHGSSWSENRHGIADAESVSVNAWMVGPDYMDVLGIELLKGRWMTPMSHQWYTTTSGWPKGTVEVVLTESIAKRLFGSEDPIGQLLGDNQLRRVVGVVSDFVADVNDKGEAKHYSMFLNHLSPQLNYIIRYRDGQNVAQLKDRVETIIIDNYHKRKLWRHMSLREVFDSFFSKSNGMLKIFTALSVIMILLCLVGVYGHGQFHAHQQSKNIGIRRALGASKQDILGFVMQENVMLLVMGCGVGVVLSFALNYVFSHYVSVGKPSLLYLAGTILVLCLGSVISVFGPAKKAANVSPVEATRLS